MLIYMDIMVMVLHLIHVHHSMTHGEWGKKFDIFVIDNSSSVRVDSKKIYLSFNNRSYVLY